MSKQINEIFVVNFKKIFEQWENDIVNLNLTIQRYARITFTIILNFRNYLIV